MTRRVKGMYMKKITVENAEQLIKSSNGTIFAVSFIKADGTLREMVCRTGVSKGCKGKGLAYSPSDYDLLTVYDVAAQGYRMIRLQTLRNVTMQGRQYSVIQ